MRAGGSRAEGQSLAIFRRGLDLLKFYIIFGPPVWRRVALAGPRLLRRLSAALLLALVRASSHIIHVTLHIPELLPHLACRPNDGQ